MMQVCPLCFSRIYEPQTKGHGGYFLYLCKNCKLVIKPEHSRPGWDEEKERYLEHENSIHQEGYVKHLTQAIKPALKYLKLNFRGLDFGCGPVPTLNMLMEQEGFACEFYDPIFFTEPPLGNFDFIFATKCFEHFFRPAHELQKLGGLLKPGGILVVMTQLWNDQTRFTDWRYAQDSTHVVFYHEQTFRFIAANFGFEILEILNDRVVILQKK
jgi:SAM-dependent methyltransferase